jgi:hypothetical protein
LKSELNAVTQGVDLEDLPAEEDDHSTTFMNVVQKYFPAYNNTRVGHWLFGELEHKMDIYTFLGDKVRGIISRNEALIKKMLSQILQKIQAKKTTELQRTLAIAALRDENNKRIQSIKDALITLVYECIEKQTVVVESSAAATAPAGAA